MEPNKWECFVDGAYFAMWAVKFIECDNFNRVLHFSTEREAKVVCNELNRIGAILQKELL
jgi:hypothetical protein